MQPRQVDIVMPASKVGFVCPNCTAWTRVLETRDDVRRRECANGHAFYTQESVVDRETALMKIGKWWKGSREGKK